MKPFFATTVFASLALAADPIFSPTVYEECTKCLDAAVAKCSGDIDSKEFGHCLCQPYVPDVGEGYTAYSECKQECLKTDLEQPKQQFPDKQIAEEHDTYCVQWYDNYCYGEITEETKEKYCKDPRGRPTTHRPT